MGATGTFTLRLKVLPPQIQLQVAVIEPHTLTQTSELIGFFGQQLKITVKAVILGASPYDPKVAKLECAIPPQLFGAAFVDNGNNTGIFTWTPQGSLMMMPGGPQATFKASLASPTINAEKTVRFKVYQPLEIILSTNKGGEFPVGGPGSCMGQDFGGRYKEGESIQIKVEVYNPNTETIKLGFVDSLVADYTISKYTGNACIEVYRWSAGRISYPAINYKEAPPGQKVLFLGYRHFPQQDYFLRSGRYKLNGIIPRWGEDSLEIVVE
jgi:hypothetical protein